MKKRVIRASNPIMYVLMLNVKQDKKYVKNNLEAIAGDYLEYVKYEDLQL